MKIIHEDISSIIKWNNYHAFFMVLASLLCLWFESTIFLGLISWCSFLSFLVLHFSTLKALRPFPGYANLITSIRLLIILYLMFSWSVIPQPLLIFSLVIFVCLDWLDGFLARKFKQETTFGQYFDMELDAVFVLFCCLMLFFRNIENAWILIPGLLRYVFVIYKILFGVHGKEKRQKYAATIAGLFFIIIVLSLFIQNSIQSYFLKLLGVAIMFSFGISFYQIHQSEKNPALSND